MKIKPNSRFKAEYVQRAKLACQIGMTDRELAQLFGVTQTTINNWKIVYPEFAEALRTGKALADQRVERALYHRAIGYSFDAEEVFQYKGKIIRTHVVRHVPPDTTAQIFWLKNRRRNDWRDVHKHEAYPDNPINKMSPDELRASIREDLKFLGILPDGGDK
jgi:hypothetical protein